MSKLNHDRIASILGGIDPDKKGKSARQTVSVEGITRVEHDGDGTLVITFRDKRQALAFGDAIARRLRGS